MDHGENEFARGNHHINGIRSFWSYVKRRLARFNGIPQKTFYLHLKESEFRFNHRKEDLYKILLDLLRIRPIGPRLHPKTRY
ncbi:MAG: ISXO2-like transposase domain protein [Acidobacteria bacterium ADurb.Bin340]|nr:MAG: ISXO2-like transposase domain protein [Acidobacteria bacterium ADurb.Bin340]